MCVCVSVCVRVCVRVCLCVCVCVGVLCGGVWVWVWVLCWYVWERGIKHTFPDRNLAEEVRHSHVRYALMNIPRTKNHRHNNRKCCAPKIMMGLGGFS